MAKYAYIIVGGAAGCLLRFLAAHAVNLKNNSMFPAGTLFVNLVGSLLIGFVFGIFSVDGAVAERVKFLLIVGFLGGFTTFSAFAFENMKFINEGMIRISIMYILLSNVLGIALVFGGYYIALRFR
jgi:CrcB protein